MAKKTYEPEPEIPSALRERYATMLEVIQGRLTVSEGARRLELSRNHFQTLLHRGLGGLLAGITPGEAGRPAKPAWEAELERENARLRKENERLRGRTEMTDRLLAVASGVIRGRVRSTRVRAVRKEGSGESEEPDPVRELTMRIDAERALRDAGLPAALSCAVVGASPPRCAGGGGMVSPRAVPLSPRRRWRWGCAPQWTRWCARCAGWWAPRPSSARSPGSRGARQRR